MRYEDLPTERVDPRGADLDLLDTESLVRRLHEEDRRVLPAVRAALPDVAAAADLAAGALAAGGRIVYAGAGTSGRLGVLDAAECPPTFGTDPDRVVALIAGGPEAVFRAREGAEDDGPAGERDLRAIGPDPRDLVVGIAASGVTPWVHGVLRAARAAGSATAFVTCGAAPPDTADVVVRIDTGPEVIAGSTRLKAGTATKLVLNAVSTAAMVRTGRVHGNLMVDLRAGSTKLRRRARRLVARLTGLSSAEARALLGRAGGEVKTAVAMHELGLTAAAARERLAAAGGFLRTVLEERR